ncbi:MAG: o-succinylbenzoate synthase [Thermofilum sp.]
MEIRKVELLLLEMELSSEFRTSFGSLRARPVVLVRVEEKGGEEGWGELVSEWGPWYSYETYEVDLLILRQFLAPAVLKERIEEPSDFHRIVASVRGYPMAKAALEEALLCLHSRVTRKPLREILGGKRREIVSGVSIGLKPTVDELLREVSFRLEEGYARIKLKIEPGMDVKLVEAVRREFGDIMLQVDANGAYRLEHLPTLRKLDKYDLLMIEQPLAYDDLVEHSILSRKLSTPVCLDESIKNLHDMVLASMIGSAEVVNIKPARVGGVLEAKRMLDAAPGLGLGAWIGGMLETGIGRAFLVALASHPSVNYPNDISASSRYWREDIVDPPWTLTPRGTIEVPEKPGLGVEVREEVVEKFLRERWAVT